MVLLIGAGLMLRTLWALQHVDLGLNPSGVLTMRISLPSAAYNEAPQVVNFYSRLTAQLRAISGVKQAGAARSLPLGSQIGDFGLMVDGYVPPPGTNAKGDWQIVTDGYMEAIGEQVVRGRTIAPSDTSDSQLVGLINDEMARRYWAGRDPIGGRFRIGNRANRPWITVVGIVKGVKHNGITGVVKEKFYIPHTQWSKSLGNANLIRSMTIVLKTDGDPAALTSPVRAAIRGIDPNLPVADVRTMDDVVGAALATPKFTSVLLSIFAALALGLAAVGIYGVVHFTVAERTREIGVRMALGARSSHVVRLVMGEGMRAVGFGIVLGVIASLAMGRLVASMLYNTSPRDPIVLVAVAAMLAIVAIMASIVPAWRATGTEPAIALRAE